MRWNFWRHTKKNRSEIHPDEIFIDSSNLPSFDTDQFEGRLERPLSGRSFLAAGATIGAIFMILLLRAGGLQLVQGAEYAKQARENQLAESVLFADRGLVQDRTGRALAWNEREHPEDEFALRLYADTRGLAHVVGYAKAPAKDSSGFYFREYFEGVSGVELVFDERLRGENGTTLTETDARGSVVSEAQVKLPKPGETLVLSVDSLVTQGLFDALASRARASSYQGAAGVIMDVKTGELLALTSFPEYSQAALASGDSTLIAEYQAQKNQPFLDRAVDGLYAPGSIVKPMLAAAAIQEGVIDEYKQILSTGSISIPNPYFPDQPSIFRDWRVNGWTNAREAIAVSSDIYFYAIGGGFQDQLGLGIERIDRYLKLFGFGEDAGLSGFSKTEGNIPTPEWKARAFPDDPTWRLGNTYHTAIGQYGTLVTPLQAVRATAAVANNGLLLTPSLLASSTPQGKNIPLNDHPLLVAREGMRQSVTTGIAGAVNVPFVEVAAKTGTAQVGFRNENQNSWMIGYWPYEKPRFAFAVVLERAPAGTLTGASAVMGEFFRWMEVHAPEYLTATP